MSLTLYQVHTEPVSTSPETVTESRWHQPFSEPRRDQVVKGFAIAMIASGAVISPFALTRPETVTADRWVQPISQPYPAKRGLPAHEQQFLAFASAVLTETVTLDKWYAPFREPVRAKPSLPAGANEDLFLGTPPIVPNTFPPFAEPVRVKPGLPAATQQFLAFVKADPFPENVSAASWVQPFAIPARLLRSPPDTQSSFIPVVSSEIITLDKWYEPWSEPIKTKLRSSASDISLLINFTVPPPAPPFDGWGSFAWSMPVRKLVGHGLDWDSGSVGPIIPIPNPPPAPGVYTVSGLYVIDQFTDNTVVYDYSGGVSHRTN